MIKTELQSNNLDLRALLDAINNLPEKGSGSGEDISEELTTQDALISEISAALDEVAIAQAEAFAAIGVVYPEGSILTCTNGTKTLEAETSNGKYCFLIPEAGTWIVTSTDPADDSKTKSAEVEITEENQFESIELSYGLIIYKNGVFGTNSAGTSFNATIKTDNTGTVTKGSEFMTWEVGENAWAKFYITPKTSFFGYKTLYISMENASMTIDTDDAGKGKWGLSSNTTADGNSDLGFAAVSTFSKFSGAKTLSVDISALADTSYYIAMQFGTPTSGSFSARVTKIWAE